MEGGRGIHCKGYLQEPVREGTIPLSLVNKGLREEVILRLLCFPPAKKIKNKNKN